MTPLPLLSAVLIFCSSFAAVLGDWRSSSKTGTGTPTISLGVLCFLNNYILMWTWPTEKILS